MWGRAGKTRLFADWRDSIVLYVKFEEICIRIDPEHHIMLFLFSNFVTIFYEI